MKKFILFMCTALLFCMFGTLVSCDKVKSETKSLICDSTAVARIHNTLENPEFFSPEEVLVYQDVYKRRCFEDSIIKNIDPNTLQTIARVVINKDGRATKESIVLEWQTHAKDVYNYLRDIPKESVKPELDDTITILPD